VTRREHLPQLKRVLYPRATISDVRFTCPYCHQALHRDPEFLVGEDAEGNMLQAGRCPNHGWIGSDGFSPPVPVTPQRTRD